MTDCFLANHMVLGFRLSISRSEENTANHSLCVLSGLCGGEKCGLAQRFSDNPGDELCVVGMFLHFFQEDFH